MTEPRRLKRGQMFLNLWSGWQNIFVVLGTNNAYCYGVEVAKVKGEYRVCNAKYYLTETRRKFPRLYRRWDESPHPLTF